MGSFGWCTRSQWKTNARVVASENNLWAGLEGLGRRLCYAFRPMRKREWAAARNDWALFVGRGHDLPRVETPVAALREGRVQAIWARHAGVDDHVICARLAINVFDKDCPSIPGGVAGSGFWRVRSFRGPNRLATLLSQARAT